jgi:anti-sigma B factor antagonist
VITVPPGFQIVLQSGVDEVSAVAVGELDAAIAEAFAEVMINECADRQVHVRLDVTRVTFIDSAGLTALVKILRHARRHGGDLAVIGASRAVRRVLDATGFATLSGVVVP